MLTYVYLYDIKSVASSQYYLSQIIIDRNRLFVEYKSQKPSQA